MMIDNMEVIVRECLLKIEYYREHAGQWLGHLAQSKCLLAWRALLNNWLMHGNEVVMRVRRPPL